MTSYEAMHAPFRRLLLSPPPKSQEFEPKLQKMTKSLDERKQDSLALLHDYQEHYWKRFPACQTGIKFHFDQESFSDDQSFDMESDEWPETVK